MYKFFLGFDALNDELSFNWGDHNHSVGPPSLPRQQNGQVNGHVSIFHNVGPQNYIVIQTNYDNIFAYLQSDSYMFDFILSLV